jgi:flavin-binding protein dodecin
MVEKTIELTGTSTNSIEDAVNIAVSRAAVTIDSLRHAQIVDISATITNGSVSQWRVKLKISFAVQDRLHE